MLNIKISIQQPYFYPSLGYFKLIKSVDKFVFFNNVQYIRRGWVNRNRISNDSFITVPVVKADRSDFINKIRIDYSSNWHHKQCRNLETRYGKKCLDHPVYLFYRNIPKYVYLVDLLKDSIKNICDFLKIKTEFLDSEKIKINPLSKKQQRIIEICNRLNCKSYYNLPGGRSLYSKEDFLANNINLEFVQTEEIINYLSIFDLCLGEGLEKI